MIKGLYETHLSVENLERSIDFYKNVLGLEFAIQKKKEELLFSGLANQKNICWGFGKNRKRTKYRKKTFCFSL